MRTVLLIAVLLLVGCGTTGGRASFPDLPTKLMEEPVALTPMSTLLPKDVDIKGANSNPSNIDLDDASKLITSNYIKALMNQQQLKQLQQWVRDQEKIYNAVPK